MAASFIASGRLHRVANSPEYIHPAYIVYQRDSDKPAIMHAVAGLRQLAVKERMIKK
jgi:hypothetical protein